MALPAHIAEREPTEAAPVRPSAVSPCRCSILPASMPSLSASRRPNTVAWLCPVDCTLQPRMSFVAAGERDRGLFHRRRAGMLQHAGDADAAIFLAPRRFALALVEIGVVGELQRLVDDAGEVAAVVGVADRRLERHRRRRNEILLAQPHRVHADDARGFLDHALEHVIRLRPPGAAIGRDRHPVAEIAGDSNVHLRDAVHAGQAAREIVGVDVDAGVGDIGALVAQMAHAQGEELALVVERELRLADGVARLRVADEGLRTRRLPVHRPADFARRHQQRDVFRIAGRLHAEGAADVLRDHPQFFVRHAHDGGRLAAHAVGALRAGTQRVAVVSPRRIARWRRASPARPPPCAGGRRARARHAARSLMICATSRSLSSLGTGPGQSTQRLPGASAYNCVAAFIAASRSIDRRQLLVFDLHQIGGVLRGGVALRHHHRDGIADMHRRSPPAPGGTASPSWRRRGRRPADGARCRRCRPP